MARNLEPYRGFHIFMRALERVQKEHKNCHALIVGGDEVSYGRPPPRESQAENWREYMLRQVRIDPARTHFLGKITYAEYVNVLRVSAAHVYLTYPFVLSWSLLEAAVVGCPLVASDTAPAREFLTTGPGTHVVDFLDVQAVAESVLNCLAASAAPSNGSELERKSLNCRVTIRPGDYGSFLTTGSMSPATESASA